MNKKLLVLFYFFAGLMTVENLHAQSLLILSRQDSLFLFENNKTSDLHTAEKLINIARSKNDSTLSDLRLKAALTAYRISNRLKNKPLTALSAFVAADLWLEKGNNTEGKVYLQLAVKNLNFDTDKALASKVLLSLSRVFFSDDKPKEAFQYAVDALQLAQENQDSVLLARSYLLISEIALHQKDFVGANAHLEKALVISEKLNERLLLTELFHRYGRFYYDRNEYTKALRYFQKSVSLCKNEENHCLTENYLQIGRVYTATEKYQNALLKFLHALHLQEKHKNLKQIKKILFEIAHCYQKLGKNELAKEYLVRAYSVIDANPDLVLELDILRALFELFETQGDFNNAVIYMKKYIQMKDTVFSLDKSNALAEVEAKLKNQEKENENKLLKSEQENQEKTIENQRLLMGLVIVLLLFSVVITFIFFRGKEKISMSHRLLNQQKEDIEQKNALLEIQSEEIKNKNRELILQNHEILKQKEELAQINNVKDKLFSIISHDFRSPLNSLQGALTIVQMGLLSENEQKKILGELKNKLDLTLNLLDNLLNWAKSQMQGIVIEPKNFNTEDVIGDTITLLQPQADRKNIQIVRNFFGEKEVFADVRTVELVVRNLLANAVKFTPNGGKVTLTVAADEHELNVSVADNGVGMSPEIASSIFNNKNNYTTLGTNSEKGTGLGLQLCKSYIEKCGGHIQVVSEEGGGAKFSFSIPINLEPSV